MARKREAPKPLFGLKQDFYESLDHVTQQAINLITVVEMTLQHGGLSKPLQEALQKQCDAFRAALMTEP